MNYRSLWALAIAAMYAVLGSLPDSTVVATVVMVTFVPALMIGAWLLLWCGDHAA